MPRTAMPRRDEQSIDLRTGLSVVCVTAALVGGLFFVATQDPWRDPQVLIHADFKAVSGLSKNQLVYLDGMKVGRVLDLQFINPDYPCLAKHEDRGRLPARTNDCDPSLFCIPPRTSSSVAEPNAQRCANLQAYTGQDSDYAHSFCTQTDQCPSGEVCLNDNFRHRYPLVSWVGPRFVCAPYDTRIQRLRVTMSIDEPRSHFICANSQATVATSGLGDKLVNITVGTGAAVGDGGHIQAGATLLEQFSMLEERFSGITNEITRSFSGFDEVFAELAPGVKNRNETTIRSRISNFNDDVAHVRAGKGQLGAWFYSPKTHAEFPEQLKNARTLANKIDRSARNFSDDFLPIIRTVTDETGRLIAFVSDLKKPETVDAITRALVDPIKGSDLKQQIALLASQLNDAGPKINVLRSDIATVRADMNNHVGPLAIVTDPAIYDSLMKMFGDLARTDGLKRLTRIVIAAEEAVLVVDLDKPPASATR